MLKPFTTERLTIRQLQVRDAPELAGISNTPAVSQWMAFMESGFPLEKAEALIASQNDTKEYFFAVRLPDGTLIGAMGVIDHPDGPLRLATGSALITRARAMRQRRFGQRWIRSPPILRSPPDRSRPKRDQTIWPPSGC
jgi:RimJ/RimL family protein N-acetyltransferase